MHPLICHMLDVAQVTLALWNEVLTDSIRKQFADALGLDAEATGRLLAFWAALHDLGKASPAFQRQVKPLEAALSCRRPAVSRSSFRRNSALMGRFRPGLEQVLQSETGMALRPAKRIAAGARRASWRPGRRPAPTDRLKTDQVGGSEWDDVRRELVRTLVAVLEPPALAAWIANRTDENIFPDTVLRPDFSGRLDWVGGNLLSIRRAATRSATLRRAGSDSGAAGVGRPGMDGLSAADRGTTFRGVVPVPTQPDATGRCGTGRGS